MSRRVAIATRYDPQNPRPATAQNSLSDDCNYCDWSFYQTNSYVVSFDLIGKAAYNNSQRTNFVYLGRKTAKSVSIIKFSFFEAGRLLNLITECLDEINVHGVLNGDKLIPMLEGKPGAKVTLTRDNKATYFTQSDIDMQNLKARLCFSQVQGDIMLHLHSPVSAEITNKLKGWIGPVASLTLEDVERLEAFLRTALEERE